MLMLEGKFDIKVNTFIHYYTLTQELGEKNITMSVGYSNTEAWSAA